MKRVNFFRHLELAAEVACHLPCILAPEDGHWRAGRALRFQTLETWHRTYQ